MFRRTDDRLPSGVEGLDRVLCGGLLRPSSYLLAGGPGTGKTVLGSQMAFHLAANDERIFFVSVLTEPYSHLLGNLSTFTFFDESRINRQITFISAFSILEAQGLPGLEEMLRLSLPRSGAALVVLDNIGMLSGYAQTPLDYRAFLQKTIALATMSGATIVASTDRPITEQATEYGSFDGVIELRQRRRGMRTFRTLEVRKSRGSFHLPGEHVFEILSDGLVVFPRLESGWKGAPADVLWPGRLSWGISGLDEMLGGVKRGSVTCLMGPTGSGKTTFCLAFAGEGLRRGEKVLFVSYHESAARLVDAAGKVGIDLESGLRSGLLEVLWLPQQEDFIDRQVALILQRVEESRTTRLVLDGADALQRLFLFPDRVSLYWAMFFDQLRGKGVTTLFSSHGTLGRGFDDGQKTLPWSSIDNVLLILYDARELHPRKVLHVAKTRGTGPAPRAGELEITDSGLRLVPISQPTS